MKIPWRRCAEPEPVVLALAVANRVRIGYLIDGSSGVACIRLFPGVGASIDCSAMD